MLLSKLLWIDDQRDFMLTATPLIADIVSEIKYCFEAEEALQTFDAWKPDLVLLDLKMPPGEWGGLTFLKHLGCNTKITPIIVLSGAGTITQWMEALDLGAIHYVEKERLADGLKIGIEIALNKFKSKQTLDDYDRICKIERDLHQLVLSVLHSEAEQKGQNDIFLQLIPKEIALKTYQRRVESGRGCQEEYLDLIDMRTIIDRNYKMPSFELLDVIIRPRRREDRTKWLMDLNEIRKIVAHPVRNELSNEQRQNLEYYETTIRKWKELIVDRTLI